MTDFTIRVADDYSPTPLGRYKRHGEFSGQRFREEFLIPALNQNRKIIIDFDGVAGLPSSFLEEAFGGLIRIGIISAVDFFERVTIRASSPSLSLAYESCLLYTSPSPRDA